MTKADTETLDIEADFLLLSFSFTTAEMDLILVLRLHFTLDSLHR